MKFYCYIENLKTLENILMWNYNLSKLYLYQCAWICCLKNFSKLLKRKKNSMNGTALPQILQVTLVSQLLLSNENFLIVTFSYQPVSYSEFKLWIMTKSKSKTKVMLMEPITSSINIILVIESYYWHRIRRSCSWTILQGIGTT